MTFSPEQLNFFKFSTVVLDEFPVALRQVFIFMWDNLVTCVPKWDDSVAVRNMFLAKEGGKTKYVSTGKSIKEWDCTALFEATIFAKTFAMPDGTGKLRTLKELYAKSLPGGTFHHTVISSTGNQAETCGLALDQLRLLRNMLCHQVSTRKIDKATFDGYVLLAKEAFTALGQNSTRIDEIGKLNEEEFPTARQQKLEDELQKEKDAAIKFQQIEDHLKKIESQVEDLRSDVKNVKTGVTDVKRHVEDVRSDMKDVKTGVTEVKTQVECVGADVRDVKTGLTDVKTQVEDVGSDVKNVKTGVTDVKTQVEHVRSDMKDVKTGVTDVKTQVEVVGSDMKDVKTEVTDAKTQVEYIGSDMKDVKTGVTDMKTQVEVVRADVKDVKIGVTEVKTQVEDVGLDVKHIKSGVIDTKTQVEYVVKTGRVLLLLLLVVLVAVVVVVTAVKTPVEDVGSDSAHHIQQAMQGKGSKDLRPEDLPQDVVKPEETHQGATPGNHGKESHRPQFPYPCIPDKIPHFVGRLQECQTILDHLTNRGTRLVNVWGSPGFGKTSVAINVAHQLQKRNIPIFFTSLRGMTSKNDLVSKLLSIFAADAKQALYVSPSHWLMQCLQQLRNPFVLVLDNADDLLESGDAKLKEDVLRFVEEILNTCSHIKLLFTTRESLDYLSHKIPIHNERVGVLDVTSSVSLVQSLLPNVSHDNCSSIVKVCGQVPLAMRLMCSIMREEHVSLNELLEELKILPIVEILNVESFPEDARLMTIIDKSFERLTGHERATFVSLVVFPESFGAEEATAVLDLKTLRQTKNVIRSLQRKALIDCSEDFSTFTIHSLLRSFIDRKRATDQETRAIFHAAEHRFYSYYISCFEMANERFLTGQSNDALVVFLNHRDSIILSLVNGPSDEELYPKAVEVLSKAELFLFALMLEESLFKTIYDTAVKEAQKRQEVNDECKLLAAKSFSHWGWFSADCPIWDGSFPAGLTDSADYPAKFLCYPAKFLCYYGIYQLLCGKLDEGITSLKLGVKSLSSSSDETILKQLVYDVLAISYWKKGKQKMASHFTDLHRIMDYAYVGILAPTKISSSLKDNAFCLKVTSKLLSLLLSERKTLDPGIDNAIRAWSLVIHSLRFQSVFECGRLGRLQPFLKYIPPIRRLNASELEELFSIQTNVTIPTDNSLLIHPSNTTFFSPDHIAEALTSFKSGKKKCRALFTLNQIAEALTSFDSATKKCNGTTLQLLKDLLWGCEKVSEDDRCEDFKDSASTYDILGQCLYLSREYSRAIESHQCAIKVREENIGDHVDTLSSLINIGYAHFEMGDEIEGINSFQRALELRKGLGIYDHVDTANLYHTLGDKLLILRNYEEAIEAHLQAFELRKKLLGEHPLTGESLHKIAEVYYKNEMHSVTSFSWCGHALWFEFEECPVLVGYGEALAFCQQALAVRLKLLQEHVDTAKSFHLLGSIHYEIGDTSSAVEAWKKASYIRSTLLGDHQDTAHSYRCLGQAQCQTGDFNGALESLQKALQLKRKLSKADDEDIADVTNDIGLVYFNMGNYKSAKKHFRDAVDLCKRLLGKHKSTAISYNNLAKTYFAIKSYPKALKWFKQASTMRFEILGEHVHTANSFHALGGVYYRMGNFTSAIEAFQKASDMRSNLLGDHPDMTRSYYYAGVAQFYTGDLEGALEYLQKAVKLGKRVKLYPGMADIIDTLGRVHLRMGDYQSAREQFQEAVNLNLKFRGNKNVNTAKCCHNLASTYLLLRSYPKALDVCQRALDMRPELLGHNGKTLKSLETLEFIHVKMGNNCSAVEAFCQA